MTLLEAITLSQELEAKARTISLNEKENDLAWIKFIQHARDSHAKFVESCRVMHGALGASIKYANELSGFRGENPAVAALETVRKIWEEK